MEGKTTMEEDWVERRIGYREGVGGEKDCERSIGWRNDVSSSYLAESLSPFTMS